MKVQLVKESPVSLIFQSSNISCAYAYIRSIASLSWRSTLRSCFTNGFSGQKTVDSSVFDLRCLASETNLLESINLKIFNVLRKVFPWLCFSWSVQPFWYIFPFLKISFSSFSVGSSVNFRVRSSPSGFSQIRKGVDIYPTSLGGAYNSYHSQQLFSRVGCN